MDNSPEYTVTITDACRSPKNPHAILPVSRPTAYAWIKAGILPQPVNIGPRLRGWHIQTLRDWLNNQSATATTR